MKAKLTLATMAALAALGTPALHAQQTWDGDTDTTFDTGSNWVSGTAPTSAQTATFGASVAANQPNLTASRTIGGLIFQSTTGGWTLSGAGNTLTVGGSGIVDSSTSGVTNIAPTIAIGAARPFSTSGGTLRLNGGLQLNGNAGMSGATGTIEVSSISYEGAETTNTFLKSGGATVNITGAAQSGWVGAITLQSGGLNVGNNTALGGGIFNWTNSSSFGALTAVSLANNVVHTAGVHTYVGNNSITHTGTTTNSGDNRSFVNTIGGNGVLTLAGDVYLSEASGTGRTFTFNSQASTGTTVVSGNISNFNGGPGTAGSVGLGGAASSSGTIILSGTNTYTGATTMAGSVTAIFRNKAALPSTTTFTSGGGNIIGLGVGGTGFFSESDVQNLFAGTLPVVSSTIAAGTDVGIDTTAGDFTYSVDQGGGRDLVKLGANTLTLSGNNSYTGATIVSQGTLLVNGSLAAGSNATVSGGAEFGRSVLSALSLGATTTFADNSRIVLALDAGLTHASLNRTGGTWSFDADQSFRFLDLGGATSGIYTGLITGLTGSEAGLASIGTWSIANAGWTGTFSYNSGSVDLNLTVIPEPSTWALLAVGLTTMVVMRRRRRA